MSRVIEGCGGIGEIVVASGSGSGSVDGPGPCCSVVAEIRCFLPKKEEISGKWRLDMDTERMTMTM